MIAFGIVEIIFSQIPDFDQIWWLSIVAAVMSFTYSSIGLGLGIAQVAGAYIFVAFLDLKRIFDILIVWCYDYISAVGSIKGSLTGIGIGTVTQTQKIWRSFQALGDIAFAYSFSIILIEIQVRACGHIIYLLSNFDIKKKITFSNLVSLLKRMVQFSPQNSWKLKTVSFLSHSNVTWG